MKCTELNALSRCLGGDLPFALYFLPDDPEPEFLAGKVSPFETLSQDERGSQGFVFAPYKPSVEYPSLLIHPDFYAKGYEAIGALIRLLNVADSVTGKAHSSVVKDMSKDRYIDIVKCAVGKIKSKDLLTKVVISRSESFDLLASFDAVVVLEKMKEAMPSAFCYLVYIPGQGTWMGATPECLLVVEGKIGETNALAGTLANGSEAIWSGKEKDEQQIVSHYIAEQLQGVGINNYNKQGPEELISGSVRHLRTVFSFDLENDKQILSVLNSLHPTPAVCGMPKEEAAAFIAENEPSSREYYTGYLGPLAMNKATHVFVNLRCMKIIEDKAKLYVGAGITSGSEPEKEWEETGIKALTLLNVIRN